MCRALRSGGAYVRGPDGAQEQFPPRDEFHCAHDSTLLDALREAKGQ